MKCIEDTCLITLTNYTSDNAIINVIQKKYRIDNSVFWPFTQTRHDPSRSFYTVNDFLADYLNPMQEKDDLVK